MLQFFKDLFKAPPGPSTIIGGVKYDTNTAEMIGYRSSCFYDDFAGEHRSDEGLYRKKNGTFFLSGDMSGHPKIQPLTEAQAMDWAEENMSCEEYEKAFGQVEE